MDLATATLGGTAVDTTYRHFDVLPSAVVTVMLGESQNLRFAASQTLSRPEYRERAPVKYYDVIEDDLVEGRTDLRQATIRNGDIRWEWYPSPAELVSIGLFTKRFTDPIERVYLEEVLPAKLTLDLEWLDRRSVRGDLRVLAATVRSVFAKS